MLWNNSFDKALELCYESINTLIMAINYQKICLDLISGLSQRQKEVILSRFGLKTGRRKTLEAVGNDSGITRERVRQIENDGFLKIKPKLGKYQKVFQSFSQYLRRYGGLKRETILLEDLGGKKSQPQIYFLLTVSGNFERFAQDEDFYSLWAGNKEALNLAKKNISSILAKLREIGKPATLNKIRSSFPFKNETFSSYLEVSKKIQKNEEGFYGLKDWPEINPRGIKDRAYLVFKKVGKPLHFNEVAKMIEGGLVQTVHNELIRDPRFVLVGRGIYALGEWGYYPGEVKDVISKILKESGPLTKEEISERVLKQRMVKENTIFLNLSNKNYFLRNSRGKYQIKEV